MKPSADAISLMQSQLLSSLESPILGTTSEHSWAYIFSLLISNGDPIEQLSADQLFSDNLSPAPLSLLIPGSRINQNSYVNQSGSIKGLSSSGRNMALADPESAYKMMTVINYDDVFYKAQYSELNQVETCIAQMQDAGQSLGCIVLATGNDKIKSSLQDFVGQYNIWIRRINPDIQQGGLLADTQAAQISQYELEQNLKNRFFGGKDGVLGLHDLGISIDPHSQLANLDSTKLDTLLAVNKQGVVDALQEFSTNFAKSAGLLNSKGNFILRQIDNLNRAIHYIADNKASLQAEFGFGNAAQPAGKVAEALAAYNQTCGA